MRAAAAVPDDAPPPLDQQQLDVLLASHGYLRPTVQELLVSLELDAAPADRGLLDAIAATDRLVRTNFLLAYLADAPLRRRIGAHALRRHVAFSLDSR